jgi:hypothetical protein
MPLMTVTRECTPEERAVIARRMQHKRVGTLTSLFRGDDGRWVFFEEGQWEELAPSARAWNRDVRLALDGHWTVVSIATDGPRVAVERRDLQPPDYLPTPDSLVWSPPDDQDQRR